MLMSIVVEILLSCLLKCVCARARVCEFKYIFVVLNALPALRPLVDSSRLSP